MRWKVRQNSRIWSRNNVNGQHDFKFEAKITAYKMRKNKIEKLRLSATGTSYVTD